MAYELEKQTVQKDGTHQCWWLSLLEVLRASHKLDPPFDEGGKLHAYYVTGGHPIPDKGTIPAGATAAEPAKEVYGPQWQRMIMFYLLDKENKCTWHSCNDTVQASSRPLELAKLLGFLGVTGVSFDPARNLTALNVAEIVNGLPPGQRVILDKKDHAMSGIVEQVPQVKPKASYNKITVYNQQRKTTVEYTVRKDDNDKDKIKLLSKTGNTELNWLLPVRIV